MFEFQSDQIYYVDLRQMHLALKLNFAENCGYETYNNKEVKKEHKGEANWMTKRQQRRRKRKLQFLSLLM